MNTSLFIAKRYIISKKSHNAINIITLISVLGVCVGTMALVIILSAFNGISGLVFNLYNTFDPNIKITPTTGKFFVPDSIAFEKIKKIKGVAYYVETIQENALLKYHDKQVMATIKGVSSDFVKMTRLDTVIPEGNFMLQNDSINYTVIGNRIATRLNVSLNDFLNPIEIYIPKRGNQSYINPEDAFFIEPVYVSGVFSLNEDFDSRYAILPINLARKLLRKGSNETGIVSAIELGLEPNTDDVKIKNEIEKILSELNTPSHFIVKTRYEQNELLFKTINSEKWWTFLILAFILVIATFNVIGSLTILIIEKKKDIKTLLFLGADKALIHNVFMKEGLMITVAGATSGLILGLLICWIQLTFKLVPFSSGFIVDSYPVKIIPLDLFYILITVLFIGFFAAWYPVRLFTRKLFTN